MRRYCCVLTTLFLLTVGCFAQTTSVTGTITDPSGQVWYGGSYEFQLMFADNSSTAYYNGNPLPSSNYNVKGTLDVGGSFSITLYDNSLIAPAGTYWRATICSNTRSPVETTGGTAVFVCFNKDVTVSGVSQSLSAVLSAAAPNPLVNALLTPSAYKESELALGTLLGGLYWDLNANCLKVWNGVGWSCLGGGAAAFNCVISIALNGSGAMVAATSANTYACDQQILTDFFGHLTAQSVATLAPFNGELQLTARNVWQPSALPASTIGWIAPNVVGTSFRNVLWGAICLDGQSIQQTSHDTDPTGTPRAFWNCANSVSISLTATSPIVITPSPFTAGAGVISCPTCTTSLATVQSFSSGNLAPLFTTNVTNPTTTPALSFTLSNANANTIFGNFTNASAAPTYNPVSPCGDATHALNWTAGTGFGCQTLAQTIHHGIPFTIYNSGGLVAGTTSASYDLVRIPFACTITSYSLMIDQGTITVKFWKVASGTAIPTSGNSINTSGVSISSGTAIVSTTLSDFTTTTITANDLMAMDITAVAGGATILNGTLGCSE